MRSLFFYICLFFVIALQCVVPIQANGASLENLEKVANAILSWDGNNPGDLFKAVKTANPDAPAIVSLRELSKALSDGKMPVEVSDKTKTLEGMQKDALLMVRERVREVRKGSMESYRRNNPEMARSLYGIGDIGSWPDEYSKPTQDIDCTILGTNPDATDGARDQYVHDLTRDLAGDDSRLTLADFDIVITAEGHEVQAGVFETEGGIDWAKRNMKHVTIIHPDGKTLTFVLGAGDPVKEMAMAENMARLRDMATKGGDYDRLFDANGYLKSSLFDDPSNKAASELWNRYMDMLSKAGMDFYRSNSSTATGGCLDMAKHLNEEVLTKKFEPQAKLKKTLKYVARGDNISRGVPGLEKILAADSLLGDPAYRDVIDLAKTVQASSDEQISNILKDRFGDTPDAALQELGNKSRRAILRMAEVSYQFEMDRIVLDIVDKGQRQAALDKLAGDMRIIADEGGDYSDLARTAMDHIGKMTKANESGDIDVLRKNYQSLETIRQADQSTVSKTAEYMKQTELGRKMMDMGGKVLELGKTRIEIMETAQFKSSGVDFVGEMVDGARAKGLKVMDYAGSVTMWAEVVNNVRTAKSDAELAIALGHTLVNNTFFGVVLNTAYAGIVQGDNEALAKAIMYLLIPETALGALVEALGVTAINVTAQTLFDAQMEKVYLATSFDKDGSISDFSGLGTDGLAGAREFVDILCDGAPEMVAQDLVDKSKATDFGRGANLIAIRTIAKSVRSTVDNGNPLVFTEDGPLMSACARIRKTTEDISDCAKIWGVEIALATSSERDLPGGLDKGQTRAFVKMFEQRQMARESARQAIAEAMVRTFEERRRAEVSLDEGEAIKEYEALLRLFKQLGIETEGSASLDQEGSPYNVITSWMASDREKQVNAVKAVQKFKDAYSFVLQSRNVAEDAYANIVGSNNQPLPRPLTGSLPLTAKPDMDVQIARSYLSEVSGLGAKVIKDLELIKQSPLEGDYDKEMVEKLYDVRFKRAYWSSMMRAASEAQNLLWKVEIFDKQALYDKHKDAAGKSGALSDEDAALMLEFRKHYEIVGDFVIDLSGPERIESGQKAELVCRVRIQAAGQEPRDVPEDISRQLSFAWKAGNAALGDGKVATRSYVLETPGTHRFTVTVKRTVLEGGKPFAQVLGSKDWTVDVVVPEKQAEEEKQQEAEEAKDAQAAKDAQKKAEEQAGKDTQDGATSTADQEQTSGQTAQTRDDGTWFKSSLAGGWNIEHNKARLWTARLTREIAAKSDLCRPQTVHGTISAKLESSFVPKPGEIDAKLRAYVEGNGWYPDEEGIQAFSIGPYKGRMITTTVKYKNGFGNPMAGYRDGTAHSFGYAIVLHETERRMISANFSVYAGSCWDNSGKNNALAQVKAARAEAMGIIQGLSLHETVQESPVTAGAAVVEVEQAEEEKEKKYQLTLTRVSPASGPVIVGTPVTYKATLSGDKPEGEVRYQFEPHPDVAFTPHEGPSASTTAVFSVPEKVGVWVTAVDKTGTIATSDQLEIEIQKPVLELAMEPKAPLVGQEVKARLTVKPEVKDIDFRWMPVPGNAKHVSTSKDNKELIFYLKDDKAAEIQVNARVPFSGEDLGEARASATAKKYAVTVSAPRAQGPPPRVWKEGVGLVTVDKAIAVDQIVEFSVALQPAALSGPVKYQWKVENGPCRVSNPSSSVARVTANAAGTCDLSVTLRDRNDVELGTGKGSFSASVTQEAIRQGEQKAQSGSEAQKLAQNAPTKARKGDYDGAIKDAEEAARLDPKNTAAKALADKLRKEKDRIHAQLEKTRKFMEERRYTEAQKELVVAKNLNSYYPPIHETEEALGKHWNAWNQEANQKNYEIRSAIEKKEFGKALEIAAAWRASTVIAPATERELKQNEDWARKWQTQKEVQIALLREAGEMVKQYDYAGALRSFEQGFLNRGNVFHGLEPEYKEAMELQLRAATADKRLREIVPALETVIRTKTRSPADIERGTRMVDEALALQPDNQQFAQWRDMLRSDATGAASVQGGPAASATEELAARKLWQEAGKLQIENDYAGALQKYREGLKLHADPAIENRVKTLEKYVAVTKGTKPAVPEKSVPAEAPSKEPSDALPGTKQADAAKPGSLVGEWEIVSPGNKGRLLILEHSGAQFSGRAYPDQALHDTDISGSVSGNTISFTRTGWKQFANLRQDFTGTIGVEAAGKDVMKGTFSQNGKGSTTWSATRIGPVSAVPFAPQKAPASETPQAEPSLSTKETSSASQATAANFLTGMWTINANRHPGQIEFTQSGGELSGRVRFGAQGKWEVLKDVRFDGRTLRFLRPIPKLDQRYTGTLDTKVIKGTFDQAGAGSYQWQIWRSAEAGKTSDHGSGGIPAAAAPATRTSVAGASAAGTQSGFGFVPNAGIPGYNQETHDNISLDQCLALCLKRDWCKSVDYERSARRCFVQPVAEEDVGALKTTYDGHPYDHYYHKARLGASQTAAAKPEISHDNGNIYGVGNGPTKPTVFTLPAPRVLTLIQNYHWNFAKGATPGTIALRDANGRSHGPWKTVGSPGQGGVPNAYWTARPMVELPVGTYTVVDSDPGTWAQNSQSGGQGFSRVETMPAGSAVPGDGKALTTGQKYREGMRWVNVSNPGHYLERKTTAKGVRWIEHDGGKALFEFEEKGGSNIHGSLTIFDPSRNISATLYPDRFEWSRNGTKLGSHQGGWK